MNVKEATKAIYTLTYGVYIVTSEFKGKPGGATVVWAIQSSKKPMGAMVGLMEDSRTGDMIEKSGIFAINILDENQKYLIRRFATKIESEKKFEGVEYMKKTSGAPILKEAVAFIDCRLRLSIKPGSHKIYLGDVVDAGILSERIPAVFRNGRIFGAAA